MMHRNGWNGNGWNGNYSCSFMGSNVMYLADGTILLCLV